MNKIFIEDLIKAQKEIKPVKKTGKNPHFKSEFAEYDHVVETCKLACSKYNMFISHSIECSGGEMTMLKTKIIHSCGDAIESTMPLLNKAGTDQGMGSSISYAKRYTLVALLAVATEEDDDGEGASDWNEEMKKQPSVSPMKPPIVKPIPNAAIAVPKIKKIVNPEHQHVWLTSKYNKDVEYCATKLPNGEYCKEQRVNP